MSISSKLLAVALERHRDRVARGARQVEGDQALLAEPGVDQRRLADVRAAGDGQADRRVGVARSASARRRPRGGDSGSSAASTRLRMPCPCAAEIGCARPGRARRTRRAAATRACPRPCWPPARTCLPRAAQVVRDVVVLRREAGAHVDDEDHHVGLGDGLARLLGHLLDDAGRRLGLEAAGVDDDELVVADAAVAVVAVAREAGEVGDDRVARLRQPVEQRRLADVGAADEGDDGFHASSSAGLRLSRAGSAKTPPLRVTTTSIAGRRPPAAPRSRSRRSAGASSGSPLRARASARAVRSRRRRPSSPTASGALRPRYSSLSVVQATSPVGALPGA